MSLSNPQQDDSSMEESSTNVEGPLSEEMAELIDNEFRDVKKKLNF